mmetsp:Transcript_15867/g.23575  ORF Transcript_15867/g.23575 Transcript_15867/m.23575 type:complete len:102 (+) Transcript_15867:654-959(+)
MCCDTIPGNSYSFSDSIKFFKTLSKAIRFGASDFRVSPNSDSSMGAKVRGLRPISLFSWPMFVFVEMRCVCSKRGKEGRNPVEKKEQQPKDITAKNFLALS